MKSPRIISLEWARVEAERPRPAGSNARLGSHGARITMPILRVLANDDTTGFGVCNVNRESVAEIVGKSLDELFEKGFAFVKPFSDWRV